MDPEKNVRHNSYAQDAASTLSKTATGSDTMEASRFPDLPIADMEQEHDKDRPQHLRIQPPTERVSSDTRSHALSPTGDSREAATRLVDDLTLLKIERSVNQQDNNTIQRTNTRVRREADQEDTFNAPNPQVPHLSGVAQDPPNKLNQIFLSIKKLPRIIKYFLYQLPITAILTIPIFLGIFLPPKSRAVIGGPGGVQLLWFGIWLEVVWLSLWAARITTAILPLAMSIGAKIIGSGNPKKWKMVGQKLELHTALFLWMLAVLISFLPIVNNHKEPNTGEGDAYPFIQWIDIVQKVIIAFFVLSAMNFIEKLLIQWIGNSFHLRTYATRIDTNKTYINYLVHLYVHSKDRLVSESEVLQTSGDVTASGSKTPMQQFLQNNARAAFTKVGDVANRVAGDFTGREVQLSNHPRKVITELLRNTASAQTLARRLFRTYGDPQRDVLIPEDLRPAFPSEEDAEAAFGIFDRDLNGDVSMEELEAFCDEVHREKKAIAASVKDLDSVIKKLDNVFVVIIIVITIIVFISIISSSASAALASAGTVILGLAWVLQATAQEFLQSIIFVFVKHPFDVGDRVTIYGNTGSLMRGDDYYVTEISLLYTEFKKMEGHIVQAPNSLLNTIFILNHRRSGNLADVFELRMKHGTPKDLIEELQARMTEYVLQERRDFTGNILTELRGIEDAYCMTVNFICFHKSSFQNELLRLTRHNKFAHELMRQMVLLGIEQPRRQLQVSGKEYPIYQTNVSPPAYDEPVATADPAKLTATRRARADSRLSATEAQPDFADVFTARKNNPTLNNGSFMTQPRIDEEPETSGADRLTKVGSHGSQGANSNRSHLFARPSRLGRSADRVDHEKDMV